METVLSRVEASRPVAPEDAARADFYALLAALFHHAPDAKLLQTLSIAPPIEGASTDLARAWSGLRRTRRSPRRTVAHPWSSIALRVRAKITSASWRERRRASSQA